MPEDQTIGIEYFRVDVPVACSRVPEDEEGRKELTRAIADGAVDGLARWLEASD